MEEIRNAPYANGEDRISRLPDNLIHLIMSYMDTKDAVQTSVLSKRWIDVWKSLPFLEFHRSSFSEDKTHSFIMFVDNVCLFRGDIDIQRFYVRWKDSVTIHVNRWSLAAVKYNVQDISIFISECHNSAYEIPHRLLNCKSLKKLTLYLYGNARYADVILRGSMNLPQLKFLSFTGLSISEVESSKRLFSSCPVLETLHISDCYIRTDNRGI
ncbi:F-box/FBD/LRR-repeat protein At1g78750-like [Papaver somniferum]|uniref:F-box/FBD/LRR-repeat protein At1g78750-like n=1 Tax=Papaver somniferum TaxID=3469 RepID=UPI000E701FCF|nr:F-box/FBD/LRR-repeat protein At1g78750-like [Papaver somniferum]